MLHTRKLFSKLGVGAIVIALPACGQSNSEVPLAPTKTMDKAVLSIRGSTPRERVLWNFTGGNDGADPVAGVIEDREGNLYGDTIAGAYRDDGTVFKLFPSGGSYAETTLVRFTGSDGNSPNGTLSMDSSGTLWGTTLYGGRFGAGTVFRVTTKEPIKERVVWSFGSYYNDAGYPLAGVVEDARGALYGDSPYGGAYGDGTVFKLTPSGGRYSESILHNFGGANDGKFAPNTLTLGRDGAIYGTTSGGGNGCSTGCGTVFKLQPAGSSYTETILWNFRGGADGQAPSSALTVTDDGSMYGVTYFGGVGTACDSGGHGCGTVYQLKPSHGGYAERVLWSFGNGADGYYPHSNVLFGSNGHIYGTTSQGGTALGGLFYELIPGRGTFGERPLWNFSLGPDGYVPEGNLVITRDNEIFGTTYVGGSAEFPDGVVFRFKP